MIAKRVCHIAESDFRKLNLVGAIHVLKDVAPTPEYPNGYKVYSYEDEPLNDLLDEQRKYIKEMGWKNDTVMIALHTDPSPECLKKCEEEASRMKTTKGHPLLQKEKDKRAEMLALTEEGTYLDKFLDRRGSVTYCQCPSVKQIYSIRNYWFCDSDSESTQVPKKDTKAIYLVYLGE